MFRMETKVDLVKMDPNNEIHKWFLDHDSSLIVIKFMYFNHINHYILKKIFSYYHISSNY